MRLLMWLLLGVLVYFALRKSVKSPFSKMPPPASPWDANAHDTDNADAAQAAGGVVENMLCCEACQIHFPASEAVRRGDHVYCCAQHADSAEQHRSS